MKLKFTLTLGLLYLLMLALIGAPAWMVWHNLPAQDQALLSRALDGQVGALVPAALGLLFALGIALEAVFQLYLVPPKRMAEEIQIMLNANPAHRIAPSGALELRRLGEAVNQLADGYHASLKDVEQRVADARAVLEEEKNRLAALISELAQGVLVCNIEGQILLYNNRARQILASAPDAPAAPGACGLVGLGRSIFSLIERPLMVHALDNIHEKLAQQREHAVSRFVTTTPSGQLVRVLMVPALGQDATITGFVLTLDDVTKSVEQLSRRDLLLESLTEGSRASLANIRAAVETLLSFPDMNSEQQMRFVEVIGNETGVLSGRIEQTLRDYADALKAQWTLEDMLGEDLVAAARRRIEQRVKIGTKLEQLEPSLWVRADSYSLVQALSYLAWRLKEEFGVREVRFRLASAGRLAHLDMIWTGAPISVETLFAWENDALQMGGEPSPLTLKDVIDRHAGEIWYQADKARQYAYFRLLLPAAEPEDLGFTVRISQESRPEYYDFDLFRRTAQSPELDQRRLAELEYTVFDTETTGLDPSAGDEIISIGAVRVVNGRLLQNDVFDQLVDPQRPLSPESIKVHGIKPAMLEGQPTIDSVLPAFHRFCQDSVLVAHNAAFDMRFLQLKEERTGVRFTQPVLDTLLLSAVIHPNQEAHKLEDIAARLGVNVLGRHTALGDAMVTGEVFLKMIPLLAERGIRTLGEAREAAEKTFYARVKY